MQKNNELVLTGSNEQSKARIFQFKPALIILFQPMLLSSR